MLRFRRKHDIGRIPCEDVEGTIPIEEDNSIEPQEDGEIDCTGKQTCSLPDTWDDD